MRYALGSAVFASLTAILSKVGIQNVESNLGTAIRTVVVLAMAWLMVAVSGHGKEVKRGILAVLFPGAAGRPRQRGGAHGQAEHSGNGGFFPAGIGGKAHSAVGCGPCFGSSWYAGNAAVNSGNFSTCR